MLRAIAISVPMAAFLAATGDDSDPNWWQVVVGVAFVVGPAAVGYLTGWLGTATLGVAYVAGVAAYESWWAEPEASCDPCVSGEVALPFVIAFALLGALVRHAGRDGRA